jgi:hyaluronan synthase
MAKVLDGRSTRRRYLLFALALAAALVWYADHHLIRIQHNTSAVVAVNAFAFLWLAFSLVTSHLHRDYNPTVEERIELRNRRMTVVVPLHNEDPEVFRQLLQSLVNQTRLPQRVHVIDNGSTDVDSCRDVWLSFVWLFDSLGIERVYTVEGKIGKRASQVIAFDADPYAELFVTLDSDTVLDPAALAEGSYPFSDPRVTSVAGLLLTLNQGANLLTRLTDLTFTTSFLNGRSSWSRLGSVVVNCGGLALYRGDVVRKYRNRYLNQTVFGRHVQSGDDRMLTSFALLEGRTVIQERAVGYTLLPERMWHLTRQRVRWWRSFFWGGGWLLLAFPMRKPAFWLVLSQFLTFIAYTAIIPYVLILHPMSWHQWIWPVLGYMAILSYMRAVRFLLVKRPDQSTASQWLTYLMAPFASLLMLYLATALQYVGLATMLKTGWSTRQEVEVTA